MSIRNRRLGRAVASAGGDWFLAGGVSAANCVAAYKPLGAASLAASYVNLANPGTNDAAEGVAPAFAANTGWTFDGATTYLTTGVMPAGDQTWSVLVRYNNSSLDDNTILGGNVSAESSASFYIKAYGGDGFMRARYVNSNDSEPHLVSGVYGFAGIQPYRDGTSEGAIEAGTAAAPIPDLYIGAVNLRGEETDEAVDFWSGSIQALAIYNTTLTADQVAAISTAMAAL
jgi:hypothetical protein